MSQMQNIDVFLFRLASPRLASPRLASPAAAPGIPVPLEIKRRDQFVSSPSMAPCRERILFACCPRVAARMDWSAVTRHKQTA
jgi:hypothetical protein